MPLEVEVCGSEVVSTRDGRPIELTSLIGFIKTTRYTSDELEEMFVVTSEVEGTQCLEYEVKLVSEESLANVAMDYDEDLIIDNSAITSP